jgi:hypothetical protein
MIYNPSIRMPLWMGSWETGISRRYLMQDLIDRLQDIQERIQTLLVRL